MDLSCFAKFVSAVDGHFVSRYGTARPDHGPATIGGTIEPLPEKDPKKPVNLIERGAGRIILDTERIEALTHDEWRAYGAEYSRAIQRGALRERTAEGYAAQLEAQQRVEREARANAKAEAEAKAKAEAAAAEQGAAQEASAQEQANELGVDEIVTEAPEAVDEEN